jgi:hypothetical protein
MPVKVPDNTVGYGDSICPLNPEETMSVKLDAFTEAYIECALWSSTDNSNEQGGEPLDDNYSIEDIAADTLAEMISDCKDFQESFGELISENVERAGHDFWLTRNHHGAGFWDGDWNMKIPDNLCLDWNPEDTHKRYPSVGHYLTAMSHPYGSVDLYVGDDGKIHS